ncbi:MAG: hypothetical protein AAGA18_05730 [Verrucomicrobiota bacterium]
MKKPKFRLSLVLATILGIATPSYSATFDLDLTADGDSRWFEYFADAFAQIDQGFFNGTTIPNPDPVLDGFFFISELPNLVPIQGGSTGTGGAATGADIFPFEENFSNIGSITYDDSGLTNIGVEIAPITGIIMDWVTYVSDLGTIIENANSQDDGENSYETFFSNLVGEVKLLDGAVIDISLTADITFTYVDFKISPSAPTEDIDFQGVFTISDGEFDLFVDETENYILFSDNVRVAWDVEGIVNNLATPRIAPDIEFVSAPSLGVRLSWPSVTGCSYQVKRSTTGVDGADFQDFGSSIAGDGTTKEITDSALGANAFYTVEVFFP